MPWRLTNLELPVEAPETALADALARRLGVPAAELGSWRILRKSLDARARDRLKFVYSALVTSPALEGEARLQRVVGLDRYEPPRFEEPEPGRFACSNRPVVIGSGPAGLLAGYYLAKRGYQPLILERGKPVKERVSAIRAFDRGGPFEPENNYLFGEGGAGAFSDGKLTCRMSGPDVDYVLERFVECGGKPSITYEHRPHLGSNRLPMICRNFRRATEALGGEYRFGCCVEGLDLVDGRLRGLQTSSGYLATNVAILAIGHSARDTYAMLHAAGVPMQAKAFQLGLRIEQPQEVVNQHKYAHERYLDLLGAADYSLVAHGQRDLFTFCMCAGGWVIPSVSEPEMFCTNGMSNSRHDTPFANSGLVVTLEPHEFGSDHPLAGVEIQRKYEALAYELAGRNYFCPIQRADDFVAQRTPNPVDKPRSSYKRGVAPLALQQLLPPPVAAAMQSGLPIMDRKWRGDFLRDAVLVGPEMRGSSPVRIVRDMQSFESPTVAGLYPVGEGAGFAGGIVSAAVDGLRAARKVVTRYAAVSG